MTFEPFYEHHPIEDIEPEDEPVMQTAPDTAVATLLWPLQWGYAKPDLIVARYIAMLFAVNPAMFEGRSLKSVCKDLRGASYPCVHRFLAIFCRQFPAYAHRLRDAR